MTTRSNTRAWVSGLVLSMLLSMPTLAPAQTSAAPQSSDSMMKDGKMMPMGEGQMDGKMSMPAKMSRHKAGCCKMMHGKRAHSHSHHRAKVSHTTSRRSMAGTSMPTVAAKPTPAKAAPMPMKM